MQALSLTYQSDYRHLYEAASMLYRKRFSRAQNLRAQVVIFGSMLGGGLLAAATGIGFNIWNPSIPVVPVIIFALALLGLFYGKVLVPWQRRTSIAAIEAAHPSSLLTFTADKEGLRWRDEQIDFSLRWSGVELVYVTPGALAFMSGAIALVLPFNAFSSDAERAAFLALCLTYMPDEAAAKSRSDKAVQALLTSAGKD